MGGWVMVVVVVGMYLFVFLCVTVCARHTVCALSPLLGTEG